MAHKKAGGSTALGRDSASQRLGVKIHDGAKAYPGQIIIRQRGTKYRPGKNVARANDDSLYAKIPGKVSFAQKKVRKFNGKLEKVKVVSITTK
ncbi:MAG: 50S ribosomal protein L27 [Patescibacteria group bacterium]